MLNFTRFAQKHHIDYKTEGHHHCHQGWIQTHCPQCTDGRHGYHLGFSIERGNFSCWRCGPVRLVNAVAGLCRVSRERAWDIIREFGDGRRGGKVAPKARRPTVEPPPELGKLKRAHRRYLTEARGFSLEFAREVAETWQLQGTTYLSGLWNWRIVAPIKNDRGEVLAYVGRTIQPDVKPKYKMTDDDECAANPQTFLYGIEKVPADSVMIVEGPADAWNMGPGAVACLGIDWKQEQAHQLRKFKRRFIMFDPEPLAQMRAVQLAEWLSLYPGETEVISGLPSDPGSLTRKVVKRIRRTLKV